MTAFQFQDTAQVDRLYDLAISHGGVSEGAAGYRPNMVRISIRLVFATQMAIKWHLLSIRNKQIQSDAIHARLLADTAEMSV